MHRLFVALRLPPVLREACLDAMEPPLAGWRWQDEEQLHLTLRFIGEVDARQADDVVAALYAIRFLPVPLVLDGVGWFDQGRHGVLFARIGPRTPLTDLHKRIDRALVGAGLPPERRSYLPHVTLARGGRSAEPPAHWLERQAGLAAGPASVSAFDLMESRLGRAGAHYEIAASFR